MTVIIDGKENAANIQLQLKKQLNEIEEIHQIRPNLVTILVGENPASQVYVANKEKSSRECGINSVTIKKPANISEAELLELIQTLNHDPKIHGILVQLPLPAHIQEERIVQAIDPLKDVDGFHPYNVGLLSIGKPHLIPCTPLGCLLLLKNYMGDLEGKDAIVIGRSNIVGKPIAQLLLEQNCTVTIAHSQTRDLKQLCQNADIVIAAVGQPELIKADWIKEGAAVIDVGISRISIEGKTKLVGDVDFNQVKDRASFITPVPGGVGPMTIVCLLRNTLTAMCLQLGIENPNKL